MRHNFVLAVAQLCESVVVNRVLSVVTVVRFRYRLGLFEEECA